MSLLPQRYEEIHHGDSTTTGVASTFPIKPGRSRRNYLFASAILMVACGSAVLLLSHVTFKSQVKNSSAPSTCGTTVAEAKANGCEFDVLSECWLPKECRDRETDLEFHKWLQSDDRQLGPWPFFEDREMTRRIPDEKALSQWVDQLIFTPHEEHVGHCIFMARKLRRAMEGELRMDTRNGPLNHTIHCTNVALKSTTGLSKEGAIAVSHFGITFESC